ncbi:MAG: alkaline phosphatase family protein [Halobacteriaceae archaeon]
MLDRDAAAALLSRQGEAGYVYPAYETACVADVPAAGLSLLDDSFANALPARAFEGVATDVEHVVVLVLDGLGWDQWCRDRAESTFLETLSTAGRVTPLTSIYPSETAAAITSLHTGVPAIEHGLLGWFAYLPEFDEPIFTLPFETLAGTPLDEAHPEADASHLFDAEPIYDRAGAAGIETHAFQPRSVTGTVYSEAAMGDAERHGYGNFPRLGMGLRRHIEATEGPAYTFVYSKEPDAVSHAVGTDGDGYDTTVSTIGHVLQRELVAGLDPAAASRTLLLVTADHGHLNTDATTRVNLARDLGGISEHLARRPDGTPIGPQGGPRNLQFHVRDGHLDALRTQLETAMPCRTFDRTEYLSRGLFGPGDPSAAFERRAPDLVAVHRDAAVWDDDRGLDNVGVHGGLSRSEMLVPLAAARLDALQ